MDISLLKFPNKSHRKSINFPKDSEELAELIGIVLGDGGINNDWQLVISLNSILDVRYSKYVAALIQKLFKIQVTIRKRPDQNTLVLVCSSTNLVDFLISKGAIKGNKILQGINAPDWIRNNKNYAVCFVRGLVDTDGCLFLHKHSVKDKRYVNIGFCFTSFSRKLISSVKNILTDFGIIAHVTDNGKRIYLYREKAVLQYLKIFGSSNPRIFEKYHEWRDARVV